MSESFLEKLKKGMGIEEEEKPKKNLKKTSSLKNKKREIEKTPIYEEEEKQEAPPVKEESEQEEPTENFLEPEEEIKKPLKTKVKNTKEKMVKEEDFNKKWSEINDSSTGQLALDVYETELKIIIQAAIAGIKPENLDIALEKDIVSIRGIRQNPIKETGNYFVRECFWGPFLREITLPAEIDPDKSEAEMKEGILTIKIGKISREKKRQIKVKSQ